MHVSRAPGAGDADRKIKYRGNISLQGKLFKPETSKAHFFRFSDCPFLICETGGICIRLIISADQLQLYFHIVVPISCCDFGQIKTFNTSTSELDCQFIIVEST